MSRKHKVNVILPCCKQIIDNYVFNISTCTLLPSSSKIWRLFLKKHLAQWRPLLNLGDLFYCIFGPCLPHVPQTQKYPWFGHTTLHKQWCKWRTTRIHLQNTAKYWNALWRTQCQGYFTWVCWFQLGRCPQLQKMVSTLDLRFWPMPPTTEE